MPGRNNFACEIIARYVTIITISARDENLVDEDHAKYGEGSIENSFKTPLGYHVVKEKIGEGAEKNTIFKSRINTKRSADIIEEYQDSDDDFVTSRIMWLDGKEEGKNKGGAVDSFARYIYIHGTHEEGLIGTKASHGCIRMFNADAIELFDRIKIGTKVLIKA